MSPITPYFNYICHNLFHMNICFTISIFSMVIPVTNFYFHLFPRTAPSLPHFQQCLTTQPTPYSFLVILEFFYFAISPLSPSTHVTPHTRWSYSCLKFLLRDLSHCPLVVLQMLLSYTLHFQTCRV